MGIEIIAEGKISVGNGETLQEDGGGASIGEGGRVVQYTWAQENVRVRFCAVVVIELVGNG